MSRFNRAQTEWAIAGVLLVAVMLICLAAFYPGGVYYDSNQTIMQARSGDLTDGWTPMGSLVLRAWFELGLSLSLVYLVQTALMIAGVFALARHALSPAWAAVTTSVVILWPPTFAIVSTLSRDMFFIAFVFLSLAALGHAYRATAVKQRRIWVGAALLLAFLAFLWRQNAISLVAVVAAAGFVLLRGTSESLWSGRLPTRAGLAAAGVAVVAAIASAGIGQVMNRVTGVEKVHPEQVTYIYDLSTLSLETGENQFDPAFVREPTAWRGPIYSQQNLDERFNWVNVITIYPPIEQGIRRIDPTEAELATRTSKLQRMWREAVLSHPIPYLKTRARVTASSLGLIRRPYDSYPFIEDGFGPPGQAEFGDPPRFAARNQDARDYIAAFAGVNSTIPLDIILIYLALGLVCGIHLWRRRPQDRGLVFAILGFQWLSLAFFFLATMATSYRYLAFITPLTMVIAAWSIAQVIADRKARPG